MRTRRESWGSSGPRKSEDRPMASMLPLGCKISRLVYGYSYSAERQSKISHHKPPVKGRGSHSRGREPRVVDSQLNDFALGNTGSHRLWIQTNPGLPFGCLKGHSPRATSSTQGLPKSLWQIWLFDLLWACPRPGYSDKSIMEALCFMITWRLYAL